MTVPVTGGAGPIGMAVRALPRARGVPVLATDITAHGHDRENGAPGCGSQLAKDHLDHAIRRH